MLNNAKMICSNARCKLSYTLKINHHEMYKWFYQGIVCALSNCKVFNYINIVINYSTKCLFCFIYCADCKTFSNVSVFTDECNVIQAHRSIFYDIKYFYKSYTKSLA